VTSSLHGGVRKLPSVFTENGVAMLSGILNSDRAITVNIAIMRTFTKLRIFLMMNETLSERINKLEEGTTQMFRIIFERMDSYEEILTPALDKERRKIGIK
jgi:hypothetical protein